MKKCTIVKLNGLWWLVRDNELVYDRPYRNFGSAINRAFKLGYWPEV